jgi:hypothetical protein
MNKKIIRTIRYFLLFAVVETCLIGLVYAVVQQNYRQSANDPQIQISEDIASEIGSGLRPSYPAQLQTGISDSLSTFVIVYNKDLQILTSTADISGIPNPPKGVFEFAENHYQNRITWQPNNDLRLATVITHFEGKGSGYVLAARSLREVERREDNLTMQTVGAWVITLFVTLISIFILI